jgi:uroporphyrinogen-III synthase
MLQMPRVLITRSPHQASELADRLRAVGAEPILIPTIELAEPSSFAVLDDALGRLEGFHWLIFTSANAAEAFGRRGIPQGLKPAEQSEAVDVRAEARTLQSGPKIAAIGPATARAVTELFGSGPDLMPTQAVAESLAEALLPYARQTDRSATRFLLVRAERARDHLPEALRAAGAEVTMAPAYRTVIPAGSAEQIREMFASPESWPDAITFTSSSTATNLFVLLDSAGITLPPAILRASIGPITSQTLRDLGYPPQLEAAEPTVPALVEILVKTLNLSKSL